MSDTQRTRAELQTLFANNTSGNISAQDLRDFVASVSLKDEESFTATIEKGDGWENLTIPIWQSRSAITISKVCATVIGSSTPSLSFDLEARDWAFLNSAGTKLANVGFVSDADGTEVTSFDDASIDSDSHLVFVTGSSPESGDVSLITLSVQYTVG